MTTITPSANNDDGDGHDADERMTTITTVTTNGQANDRRLHTRRQRQRNNVNDGRRRHYFSNFHYYFYWCVYIYIYIYFLCFRLYDIFWIVCSGMVRALFFEDETGDDINCGNCAWCIGRCCSDFVHHQLFLCWSNFQYHFNHFYIHISIAYDWFLMTCMLRFTF